MSITHSAPAGLVGQADWLAAHVITEGSVAGVVPVGGIVLWSTTVAVPTGWALADGTANSPGPDMRSSFIGARLAQQKTGTALSSLTVTVTLDAAATVGNTLICCSSNSGDVISSISGAGTWTLGDNSGTNVGTDIWFCSVTSPATVITITYAGTNSRECANVSEWSGLQASPLDTHNSATGNSTTPTTASITPTTTDNLVVAVAGQTSTYVSGPTNGFTGLTTATAGTLSSYSGYKIQQTATAATTAWTTNASAGWDAQIVAFKAYSGVVFIQRML